MIIEVAVSQVPCADEVAAGKPETLLLPPTAVVAESDQAAILSAGVQHAAKFAKCELSRIKVIVRRVG